MKRLSLCVLLLLLFSGLSAYIFEYYTFVPTSGTYTSITGMDVPSAIGDDVLSDPVQIGFSFPYGTNSYSQVQISSNGVIALGSATGTMFVNALSYSYNCPVLAPLWDDNSTIDGSVQTSLVGMAPRRVFTVQYDNLRWHYSSSTVFDFQVKLFENGKVEFIYGTGTGVPTAPSASIGINMLPGGNAYFYSVIPGNPAHAYCDYEVNYIDTYPGEGTVYRFNPTPLLPNDLTCLSISGNTTPSVGESYDYTVTLRNMSAAVQSDYSVKLMNGTAELAAVPGPPIQPLTSITVTIPWTPTLSGAVSVKGAVTQPGDGNPANDQTSVYRFFVQPAGAIALTVGMGEQQISVPVDFQTGNDLYECIIPAAEIGATGTIYSLAFYNIFPFVSLDITAPARIWLGTTQQSDLSGGWIPSTALTQVFDNTVFYATDYNPIIMTPIIPFAYTGGNLVMMCYRPSAATYGSSEGYNFYGQTVGTNRARKGSGGNNALDPANPPANSTLSGQYPKTTFYFTPATPQPVFSITPTAKDWGSIILDSGHDQTFTFFNSSVGSLSVMSIELSGSPMFTLSALPDLPVTIATGQSSAFTVHYQPTAVGIHTATVTLTDDLTRTQHVVTLQGSCFDPTIYALPYVQNFDTVSYSPNLPIDWQKIQQSTAGYIRRYSSSDTPSPYNGVYMCNLGDTAANLQLISPPLADSIPMHTIRVKFWARGWHNCLLQIGVMDDPQDASTFTPVQTINLTGSWMDYYIDLQSYTGSGRYISFKHGSTATNQDIYIDSVRLGLTPQTDLVALSVTGENMPYAGTSYDYTVSVKNYGSSPQTDYLVKLCTQDSTEVASIAGLPLAANQTATVVIPWTPSLTGATGLFGIVILSGDQNPANNASALLPVNVLAPGTVVNIVGDGSETARIPVDVWHHSSLFETLFFPEELGFIGNISGITLYNSFSTDEVVTVPVNIWLGHTTRTNLTASWIASTANGMTQVFSGVLSLQHGQNEILINFTQPFLHLQGNLVLLIERDWGTDYDSNWDNFRCQTVGTNRSRNISSWINHYNPANPPTNGVTLNGQFPQTGFIYLPIPSGQLTGTVYDSADHPLANAVVHIANSLQTTSNEQGEYAFPLVNPGNVSVSATKIGYATQSQIVAVAANQTAMQDFHLETLATVVITGRIVGRDAPYTGLSGAVISFTGYTSYTATADSTGYFSLPGVYVNHTYDFTVSHPGFVDLIGAEQVLNTDDSMGDLILWEICYPPSALHAAVNQDNCVVLLDWQPPAPAGSNRTQGSKYRGKPPVELSSTPAADRNLLGYKVWRLHPGEEQNPDVWIPLTPGLVSEPAFSDNSWTMLSEGNYRWAVRAIYDVYMYSDETLSNPLTKQPLSPGILTGWVHDAQDMPVVGALITADTLSVWTDATGSYLLTLTENSYSITCTATGYDPATQSNLDISSGNTTVLNFSLAVTANHDDTEIIATTLKGNFPNPFHQSTTLIYYVKTPSPVRLDIYNVKGQLVRTLINEAKATGSFRAVWDGKDQWGNAVARGIYTCRMQAGSYLETRRMLLLK